MGISKHVYVSCDGWTRDEGRSPDCEREWGEPFETVSGAKAQIRESGWRITRAGLVLCKQCVKTDAMPPRAVKRTEP